jgi:hypothetical protein
MAEKKATKPTAADDLPRARIVKIQQEAREAKEGVKAYILIKTSDFGETAARVTKPLFIDLRHCT